MSKKKRVPAYRLHKARNLAKVRINGKDHYLGPYGSPESYAEYDELVAAYLRGPDQVESTTTLSELLALWWRHCKQRYGKHGKGKFGAAVNWRPIIQMLRECHGAQQPKEFGPRAFRLLIERMRAEKDWCRGHAAENVSRIKQIFKWGASMEYIDIDVYQRLVTVPAPRRGEGFRESEPVDPVDSAVVEATLPYLAGHVADMVRFQLLTGCRCGEVTKMKPGEIDRNGDVWIYTPGHHKTEHHGLTREIAIGPRAQAVIRKYLLRKDDAYCFPTRRRPCYSSDSYRLAVTKACQKRARETGKPEERWSPGQLRHTAGTQVRDTFDVEHAQAVLGHQKVDTTEIYARVNREKAAAVARQIG